MCDIDRLSILKTPTQMKMLDALEILQLYIIIICCPYMLVQLQHVHCMGGVRHVDVNVNHITVSANVSHGYRDYNNQRRCVLHVYETCMRIRLVVSLFFDIISNYKLTVFCDLL
jgi:hypothetical protein